MTSKMSNILSILTPVRTVVLVHSSGGNLVSLGSTCFLWIQAYESPLGLLVKLHLLLMILCETGFTKRSAGNKVWIKSLDDIKQLEPMFWQLCHKLNPASSLSAIAVTLPCLICWLYMALFSLPLLQCAMYCTWRPPGRCATEWLPRYELSYMIYFDRKNYNVYISRRSDPSSASQPMQQRLIIPFDDNFI